MNKDATLIVMAAGMGSRFGGLKQLEPIGPNGEVILDFSVFDAVKAGEISLGALASSIAENDILKTILDLDAAQQLVNECIIVQKAILSGGFFAIFGMFLLIIFWTVFTNMLIKTPIHLKRKHRRKLVIKRPSAIFHK